jgi:hypothetical protein
MLQNQHPLLKKFKRYKVIQCPKCGKVSMNGSVRLISFHCLICNKSTEYLSKAPTRLNLKPIFTSDSAKEAADYCIKYKDTQANNEMKERAKMNGVFSNGLYFS